MKSFVTEKVNNIKPSGIRKFFNIASTMKDVVSLGIGEPDFDTPWKVRREAINVLNEGKTFYTSNQGLIELRTTIASYLKRKYDLDYDKSEILVTSGSSEAIDVIFRAILNEGDEVIVLSPSYVSYEACIQLSGGIVKTINLKEENEFCLTANELQQAITDKTKALIINDPNNPTGSHLSLNALKEIAEVCKKYDIFVVSDEIYAELSYDSKHYSIAAIEGMKERTLVINGYSKAFSMTGWRLGYACGPKDIIAAMTKIHQFIIMCAPTVSQYAAVVAMEECDEEVEQMRQEYEKRRNYCISRVKKLGMDCFVPKGAFYIFPCIKKFNLSSEDFAMRLLNEGRVVVVPGTAFGEAGEGFIRISYAYSLDDLRRAFDRIEKWVKTLK